MPGLAVGVGPEPDSVPVRDQVWVGAKVIVRVFLLLVVKLGDGEIDGALAVPEGGLRVPVRIMEPVPDPVRVAEVEGPERLPVRVEAVTLLDTGELVQDPDPVRRKVMDGVSANDLG